MATIEQLSDELAKFQIQYFAFKNEVNKRFSEGFASQDVAKLIESISELQDRVKVLEEARQKQIQLNSTFQPKVAIPVTKKSLWDLFKK